MEKTAIEIEMYIEERQRLDRSGNPKPAMLFGHIVDLAQTPTLGKLVDVE